MVSDTIVVLSASLATSGVGWLLFVYLRNMRKKLRTHILRSDEVENFMVKLR